MRAGGALTDAFVIESGLKQGCCLSTLLFNLTLEWVVRQTPLNRSPVIIGEAKLDKLAFADDLDMVSEVLYYLEDTLLIFAEHAVRVGLVISEEKTKLMLLSIGVPLIGWMQFGNLFIEAVTSFKYLGSTVTHEDDIENEVNLRIAAASRCAWSLNKTIKSRQIT